MSDTHKYILMSDHPKKGSNTEAGFHIIDFLFHNNKSRNKWYNDKQLYLINGSDKGGKPITSKPLNYLEIAQYIREHGNFNTEYFNLPLIQCFWLDFSLDTKINFHMVDKSESLGIEDGVPQQLYGKNYPIKPKLTREGSSYTTLQPQLLDRIMRLRSELILNSDHALEDDWFFNLRTLINDTISIIEITLNQFYIKAEYDPLPTWKFDKKAVGEKQGRRFDDKLGWIYKITGNHLGAEEYLKSCKNLRELRNHMMHFDPPSLIITIEEATIWLNQIIDIGYLLIKIRKAIGAEISLKLINFILQKEAIFNPDIHFLKRLPLGSGNSDYASSTWKNKSSR
jgi:hypothetical protein